MRTMTLRDACIRYAPDLSREVVEELAERGYSRLPVVFNSRLRTRLGLARFSVEGPVRIDINPKLEVEGDHAIRHTLLHEVAHVLAGIEAGHGPAWRRQCRKLGTSNAVKCDVSKVYKKIAHEFKHARMARKVVGHCEKCGVEFRRARRFSKLAPGRYRTHSGSSGCGGRVVPS